MRAMVLLGLAACATTANTCPLGTRIETTRSPGGRAEFCRTAEARLAALPAGRTSESAAAMLLEPTAMPGGLAGPFTSWHSNGALASHGTYLDEGSRSIPDGVWAFWYRSGQRKSLGVYRRGKAEGCFALWDEQGEQVTGYPAGDQLRVESCSPPGDHEIAILEGRARGELGPAIGDFTLAAFAGPNGIGVRQANQVDADPRMQVAFGFAARRRFGPVLLGPVAGMRLSNNFDYRSYTIGGSAGYTHELAPRVELDASVELSFEYLTVTARRPDRDGTADLHFSTALPAAQAGIAYAISPMIQAVLVARMDGLPRRDIDRAVTYCTDAVGPILQCSPTLLETWRLGGFAFGATLGLRLVLR
ncbi:MAG: toxin-antitoxin system YwqK family antitoxin [Kofleriaceae bacterium]